MNPQKTAGRNRSKRHRTSHRTPAPIRRPKRGKTVFQAPYHRFRQIDGSHSFKDAVPGGYVEYHVRKRKNGKLGYFNFALAKEMGLIPKNHPHEMTRDLTLAVLETFSIQIINEYDLEKETKFRKSEIKPNKYMATRYLQLQHPNKTGKTSGDGRGIWNGEFTFQGATWDVSSCGTGATRLSPATAIENRFFQTGDPKVSYGCGYADFSDGLGGAIMSEIFHKNGIRTERTLAIIEYPGGLSINVRANKNLLRPSHFFHHLKQGNFERLKAAIDYFIDRQVSNGDWPKYIGKKNRYDYMAEQMALTFADVAARFESDYIFCWLDWDGDNILANGGIIDYGSVRQFGLYHHEYRYDDVDRFSTNIPEQCRKARYIVQTFAQIRDFLSTGKKKNIKNFYNDPIVQLFDKQIETSRSRYILHKIGFNREQTEKMLKSDTKPINEFRRVFSFFERAKSARGKYKVADGINWDAIYCMRDILRELPIEYLNGRGHLSPEQFMDVIASSYATRKDRKLTDSKIKKIKKYQKSYQDLLNQCATVCKIDPRRLLLEVTMRSSVINRYDRITGEAILCVTEQAMKERKQITPSRFNQMIEDFVVYQNMNPSKETSHFQSMNRIEKSKADKVFNRIVRLVVESRESI